MVKPSHQAGDRTIAGFTRRFFAREGFAWLGYSWPGLPGLAWRP